MSIFDKVRERLFKSVGDDEDEGEDGVSRLESAEDQTSEERTLAQFLKDRVQEVRTTASRIAHEGIWLTNVAFVLGFDSLYYDTSSGQYKIIGRETNRLNRNRIHVNKILPTIQNRLARLCKNPPRFDVMPNSNEVDDKDAARLGLKVILSIWDKQKINEKRISLYMWMQECGHAFIKVSWDSELGDLMPDPGELLTGEEEEPQDTNGLLDKTPDINAPQTPEDQGNQDENEGNEVADEKVPGSDAVAKGEEKEYDYQGDIRVDVVSAFEMFCDPIATSMDECQWVIQAKVRKLDYFKTHYPERGQLVREEGPWLLSSQYQMRINSMNNYGPSQAGTHQQMKHAAIELAYYEKRSRKYPNGRFIVSANGVLLRNTELPVGKIPFAKFDDVIIGGKFYSESIITHMRPVQDQYNRTVTKRGQWANLMLAGKFIAARGHGIMQEGLNDQNGEMIEYDPVPNAPPPTAMNIPVIPQYAYTEEDRLQNMMYDIAGINEVSRGQLPAAGIPAIGMQLLTEADDTRIGIMTEQHEHAWAYIAHLILLYAQKQYVIPRMLKEAGKNNEYTVKEFTGADLRSQTDVKVIRGSTLPGSKVLRRQEVLNTYGQGLLGNPQDPRVREKVLEMLEYGEVDGIWEDQALDMNQIHRHIDMIEQGRPPPVNQLDNHALFIQELNRYRKTEKFEQLPPQLQQLMLNVIQEHVDTMAGILNPELNMPLHPEVQAQMAGAVNPAALAQQTQALAQATQQNAAPMQPNAQMNPLQQL